MKKSISDQDRNGNPRRLGTHDEDGNPWKFGTPPGAENMWQRDGNGNLPVRFVTADEKGHLVLPEPNPAWDASTVPPPAPSPSDIYSPDETVRFAALLGVGNTIHEVRLLYQNKETLTGLFDNPHALANAVRRHNGHYNIYMTANPVRRELFGRAPNKLVPALKRSNAAASDIAVSPVTTAVEEIAQIETLYLDFDAVRPDGLQDFCTTDAEHNAAVALRDEVASAIHATTGAAAIPELSGNGAALFYRLATPLPVDDSARVKRILDALAAKYDAPAAYIDTVVANANRIVRMPGTLNMKREAPDRCRRRATLEYIGPPPAVLGLEKLELSLGLAPWANRPSSSHPPAQGPAPLTASMITPAEYDVLLVAWKSATHTHDRQNLALALAGAALKAGHAGDVIKAVIRRLAADAGDGELQKRLGAVDATYAKPAFKVLGWKGLERLGLKKDVLPSLVPPGEGSADSVVSPVS